MLTRRLAELQQLQADATLQDAARRQLAEEEALRRALDLGPALRDLGAGVTLTVEGDVARASLRADVAECASALAQLMPVRWQLRAWRLRLEGGRCDWQAEAGEEVVAARRALSAPPGPAWSPPAVPVLAFGVPALARRVDELDARVTALEAALGPVALASTRAAKVAAAGEAVARAKAAAAPCDLLILLRELALDGAAQGQLLEVSDVRLVHPLEPSSDFRLRGLVQRDDAGRLSWRCEAP